MTDPIIVKLKSHKMTVQALKSNGKYKNITGIFKGMLIMYPTTEGGIMRITTTINGELKNVTKPWKIPETKELNKELESLDSFGKFLLPKSWRT